MGQVYFYSELGMQMLCQVLCRIDGTVLSVETAKGDHQVRETTVQITLHRSIDNGVYVFEELRELSVFFQKTDHRLVQSCKMIVSFIFTGVIARQAVEYDATAITDRIVRLTFYIGEAADLDFQHPLLYIVPELCQSGQFSQDGAQIWIFRIVVLQQLS